MNINWEKVRKRREELRMTMEDLGKLIGVQRSAINKYEKGQIKNFPLSKLEPLANALQVPPGYLMDIEGIGKEIPSAGPPQNVASNNDLERILIRFHEATVTEQIGKLLSIWGEARPETKRMILPILEELSKLEVNE